MGFFKRIRPVDVSTTTLDNLNEFIDKTITGCYSNWEKTVVLTMKGIVSDAIREIGRDRVALNCEVNFDEIMEIIDAIFFCYRNMISYNLVRFSCLILGKNQPPTSIVDQFEIITEGDNHDNA